MTHSSLLNDKALAKILCISQSWIRKQRWLRRKGEKHILDIEPIMIGSVPRYRAEDVLCWLECQHKHSIMR